MYRQSEKKLVKQQCLLHMSSQHGELWPTSGWDLLTSLGHCSKFQQGFASWLCYCSDIAQWKPTKLRDVWSSHGLVLYIYIFGGSCPVLEFCQVQNSLCVQVLRSPILAALLHGTQVVGVSQTASLNRGRHLYSAGWPSRWALAHILVVI